MNGRVKEGVGGGGSPVNTLLFHNVSLETSSVHHSVQFSNDLKIKMLFGGDTIQFLGNEFCLFLYHPSGPHHSDGSAGQREGRHVHLDCCGG